MESKRKKIFIIGALILVVLASIFCFAASTEAKSSDKSSDKAFEINSVDINANISTDGTLHVVESRKIECTKGYYNGFKWDFGDTYSVDGCSPTYKINKVIIKRSDGREITLAEPDKYDDIHLYKYEFLTGNILKVYAYLSKNEKQTITIDYDVINAVQVYDDIGDLQWTFLDKGWGVSQNNVSCSITLPGTPDVENGTCRIWGHGDSSAELHEESGNKIVCSGTFSANHYGTVRITMPANWFTQVTKTSANYHQGEHLQTVLDEEAKIYEDDAKQALFFRCLIIGVIAIFVLGILAIIIGGYKSRHRKTEFKEQYLRRAPDPKIHPCSINHMYNEDDATIGSDIKINLMHLVNNKVLKLAENGVDKGFVIYKQDNYDYKLKDIDVYFLKVLFQDEEQDQKTSLDNVMTRVRQEDAEIKRNMIQWQKCIKNELKANKITGWEDSRVASAAFFIMIPMLIIVILTAALLGLTHGIIMFAIALGGNLLFGLFTKFISKWIQTGSKEYWELKAKCDALKRWLLDFTNLKESNEYTYKVWGEFFIYAMVFDIADEVLENIRIGTKEGWLRVDWQNGGSMYNNSLDTFIVHSYWYHSMDHASNGFTSLNDSFETFSDNVKSAFSDTTILGGTPASSGGGGGGFSSGGGGGGFGGGGGSGGF